MAERYITHPFIVKLTENEQFSNLVNFNGQYFVAVKRNDQNYLYITLDAYDIIDNDELLNIEDNDNFIYGTDYIYSESLTNYYTSNKSLNELKNIVASSFDRYVYGETYTSELNDNLLNINIADPDVSCNDSIQVSLSSAFSEIINKGNIVTLYDEDNDECTVTLNSTSVMPNTSVTYVQYLLNQFIISLTENNYPYNELLISKRIVVKVNAVDDIQALQYTVQFNQSWSGAKQFNTFIHNIFKHNIAAESFDTHYSSMNLNCAVKTPGASVDELKQQLIKFIQLIIVYSTEFDELSDNYNSVTLKYGDISVQFNYANEDDVESGVFLFFGSINKDTTLNDLLGEYITISVDSNENEFDTLEYQLTFINSESSDNDVYNQFVQEVCEDSDYINFEVNKIFVEKVTGYKEIIGTLIKKLLVCSDLYTDESSSVVTMNIITNTSIYNIPVNSKMSLANIKLLNLYNDGDSEFENILLYIFNKDVQLTYSVVTTELHEDDTEDEEITFRNTYLPDLIIKPAWFNQEYFEITAAQHANKMVLDYYRQLNGFEDHEFTDEELASFCATFCKLILNLSQIENIDSLSALDTIYKQVLNYWANEGTDAAIEAFSRLSNLYTSQSSCSCSSGSGCSNISYAASSTAVCDCLDQYKQYMTETLKTMLGDVNFYQNWFATIDGDQNIELCDILLRLIRAFIDKGYTLSFSANSSFDCPAVSNKQSECNYQIIENYKDVLVWTKEAQFKQNINKIKTYGQAFGELLPNLLF